MMDDGLRDQIEQAQVDFFGVADLEPAHEAILAQGGPAIAEFPRAVSVGIGLLHAIVDGLPQRADRGLAWTYRHHAYNQVNPRLDQITLQLARSLQRAGYKALNVPASQQVDNQKICGVFSHKMAAHLAGLGWIGKSCMLITPEMGPRVRWGTVLTDAPLEVTGGPLDERCGTCLECVDICPVSAYTGRAFRPDEPREARFDARKCDRYFQALEEAGGPQVCGLCLYVCPHGRL